MGKFQELVDQYHEEMTGKLKMGRVDKKLLTAVAKSCGPSLYRKDAAKVSCSDAEELKRIKKNFLIKKLGLKDTEKLDAGIKETCKEMGSSNRNKYRAIFYYILTKKFRKSGVFK